MPTIFVPSKFKIIAGTVPWKVSMEYLRPIVLVYRRVDNVRCVLKRLNIAPLFHNSFLCFGSVYVVFKTRQMYNTQTKNLSLVCNWHKKMSCYKMQKRTTHENYLTQTDAIKIDTYTTLFCNFEVIRLLQIYDN